MTVPLTRAFRHELPEVRLSISEGLSGAILGGLNSGHLDPGGALQRPALARDRCGAPAGRRPGAGAGPPAGLLEDPPPGPIALSEVAQLPWSSPPGRMRSACMWNQKWPRLAAPRVALEIDGVSAILDPGGRWRRLRRVVAQRAAQLAAPSAYTAQGHWHAAAAHCAVAGHQLAAAIHPGAKGRARLVRRTAAGGVPVALSATVNARQRGWCEVPSLRVILFHTLYLPTGLLMGRRLTSLKVCASNTTTAPSISHTLARA